ncbi:MAG: histidine kinase dimerization/phospho-acceptor domain-containing protein, partial [Candidatus Xenobia bacterium]
MRRWYYNLTLRQLLVGAIVANTVLCLTLMGSGVSWLFGQSIKATIQRMRIREVQAMWDRRPVARPSPLPGGDSQELSAGLPYARSPGQVPAVVGDTPAGSAVGTACAVGCGPGVRGMDLPEVQVRFAKFLPIILATHNDGVRLWEDGKLVSALGISTHLPAPPTGDLNTTLASNTPTSLTLAGIHCLLVPLRDDSHQRIVEMDNTSRSESRYLSELGSYLLSSGTLAVFCGIVLGGSLAGRLSSPLERLSTAASQLARGDLRARAGLPPGRNEVMQVAGAFDRMVERMQETLEAQERFVADAGHELRTPLTTIGGLAEVLEQEGDRISPERKQNALERIAREVDRKEQLISDFLLLT